MEVDAPRPEIRRAFGQRKLRAFAAEQGSHVFQLLRACNDRASEIACGDRLDQMLNPGTYYLAIDGKDSGPFGRFTFNVRAKDVTLQDAACKAPGTIALGQSVRGTTVGAPDRFTESCGGRLESQASGDRVFQLVVPTRQHIQLLLTTPNHDGVLALRKTCLDPAGMKSPRDAEVWCNNVSPDTRHSEVDTTVELLRGDLRAVDADAATRAEGILDPFRHDWHDLTARFGAIVSRTMERLEKIRQEADERGGFLGMGL